MPTVCKVAIFPMASTRAKLFWAKVDQSPGPDGCWPWIASRHYHGYGRFRVGRHAHTAAHRVAWALHNGRDPGQMFVCHSCDNRWCCNPAHLWLGTNDDNMADMNAKGRHHAPPSKGELNGNAKLTKEQVEFIKKQIEAGKTNTSIALLFEITHQLVSRIRRGKAWGGKPIGKKYDSLKGIRSA